MEMTAVPALSALDYGVIGALASIFIGLFVFTFKWVLKEFEKQKKEYQDIIKESSEREKNYQSIIAKLSDELPEMRETLARIEIKMQGAS